MMDDSNIAAGTAVKLLLVGIVLASGAVVAIGLDGVTPRATADGVIDDVPEEQASQLLVSIDDVTTAAGNHLSDDWSARLLFPIPNATSADTASRPAFPIDSVPFLRAAARTTADHLRVEIDSKVSSAPCDARDTDPYRLALDVTPDAPRQDVDPY